MKKIITVILIIILVVILASIIIFLRKKAATESKLPTNQIILFYSNQCPHCEKVEAFIQKNNVRQKISFVNKEVNKKKTNLYQLIQASQNCKLPANEIPVPLLWTGNSCVVGDPDIIRYFQTQTHQGSTKDAQ